MVSEMFKSVWEAHCREVEEQNGRDPWAPHEELRCQESHAKSVINCLKGQTRRGLIKIANNCDEVGRQWANEGEGWISEVYFVGQKVILSYLGKIKGEIKW